jgi:FlaA1/EpsC-like NDP-sugar epimerase
MSSQTDQGKNPDSMTASSAALLDFLLHLRRPIIILVHVGLIIVANVAAFVLRFDGPVPSVFVSMAAQLMPWLIAIRLITFWPFRLFEGLWKYTSLWDLRNIVVAVTVSTTVFVFVTHLVNEGPRYPISIFVIDAVLLVCLMSGIRLTRRMYEELVKPQTGRRVLIYGAGDAGELIVRDMRHNARFQAIPIGFLDDDHRKVGQHIHGVPVLGSRAELAKILKAYAPEELLITMPSASRETLREIVRVVEPHRIRITTLPRLHELIGARVEVEQIRQLKVEDLLARESVGLDYTPVQRFLEGKRVVVTGAGGSIGSELCRQIAAARPSTLVLLERYENGLFHIHNELAKAFSGVALHSAIADVTDARRIDQVFDATQPHVVFHAAAHKHVPLMEENPCEAVKNNVRGTRIVAESSIKFGVERFVLISTDKAVNPTSVMGSTKRVAELMVNGLSRELGTRFATVRFGNVLGSNGSVVPTFLAQIAKGGPVTVTHPDMKRFFMLIPEAVQLVLHAGALPDTAPLFVLDMGEQVKVVDMARDIIRLSGFVPDKDIEITFTGVRAGEKLYEELVGEGESAEPSSLEKIWRVHTSPLRPERDLRQVVARLEEFALDGKKDEVLRELQNILAEFTHSRGTGVPA